MRHFLAIFSFFFIFSIHSTAQDITGTWEGVMGDEYIKLNIRQVGTQICGYSYDFVLKNKSSQCMALFEGNYNSLSKTWTISGTHFLDNSGDHVLMTIRLWNSEPVRSNVLRACQISSENAQPVDLNPDFFWVRKISNKPEQRIAGVYPCYTSPPKESHSKSVSKNKANSPKVQPLKKSESSQVTLKKMTNHTNVASDPFMPDSGNKAIIVSREFLDTKSRKSHTEKILTVTVPIVKLQIFDNGIIDDDTVSLFFDGAMLCSKKRLTAAPLVYEINLKELNAEHELLMYAENLGSIPPNTAMVVITAGKNRYELHAAANMDDNSVIKIRYVPVDK